MEGILHHFQEYPYVWIEMSVLIDLKSYRAVWVGEVDESQPYLKEKTNKQTPLVCHL